MAYWWSFYFQTSSCYNWESSTTVESDFAQLTPSKRSRPVRENGKRKLCNNRSRENNNDELKNRRATAENITCNTAEQLVGSRWSVRRTVPFAIVDVPKRHHTLLLLFIIYQTYDPATTYLCIIVNNRWSPYPIRVWCGQLTSRGRVVVENWQLRQNKQKKKTVHNTIARTTGDYRCARKVSFVGRPLIIDYHPAHSAGQRRSPAHEVRAAGSVESVHNTGRRNIRFVALKDYAASLSRRQSSHQTIRFVYTLTSVTEATDR